MRRAAKLTAYVYHKGRAICKSQNDREKHELAYIEKKSLLSPDTVSYISPEILRPLGRKA